MVFVCEKMVTKNKIRIVVIMLFIIIAGNGCLRKILTNLSNISNHFVFIWKSVGKKGLAH